MYRWWCFGGPLHCSTPCVESWAGFRSSLEKKKSLLGALMTPVAY